jgi:trimeric autotransporter adhesin
MKTKNTRTICIRNLITWSPLGRGFLLVALASFTLALAQAISPPPDGGYPAGNTAEGQNALFRLTAGINNTAVGFDALFDNTTGSLNIANGYQALYSNTTGSDNTANGYQALYSSTTGRDNTANGFQALCRNITGSDNTANGYQALFGNTTGSDNTANGFRALSNVTIGSQNTGSQNTANGAYTLYFNTTGYQNTAAGYGALFGNTTGYANTVDGFGALSGNTTGKYNIALGYFAGSNVTTGSNNIDIGNVGAQGESNTIRIGAFGAQTNTNIAGIYNVNEGGTISAVYINSGGQLGTQPPPSSRRFKKNVKPMEQTSVAILGLKPVTFQYESDTKGTSQFGLIAEEVAEVNPDLVIYDADGQPYTVRYDAVNAMLLNEFLKEHKKVEEQARTIAQQRRDFQASITKLEVNAAQQQKDFRATATHQQEEIKALTASLKEQASQIHKVSTQLELSKSAPQLAGND